MLLGWKPSVLATWLIDLNSYDSLPMLVAPYLPTTSYFFNKWAFMDTCSNWTSTLCSYWYFLCLFILMSSLPSENTKPCFDDYIRNLRRREARYGSCHHILALEGRNSNFWTNRALDWFHLTNRTVLPFFTDGAASLSFYLPFAGSRWSRLLSVDPRLHRGRNPVDNSNMRVFSGRSTLLSQDRLKFLFPTGVELLR